MPVAERQPQESSFWASHRMFLPQHPDAAFPRMQEMQERVLVQRASLATSPGQVSK